MASVRVNLNITVVNSRMANASQQAIHATSQQALKDCNYYCKQDQSTLIDSSLTNSDLENGKLIWKTPYARKQYYLKSANKDPNANAEWMWAHKAQSVHNEDWKAVFQAALKQFAKE